MKTMEAQNCNQNRFRIKTDNRLLTINLQNFHFIHDDYTLYLTTLGKYSIFIMTLNVKIRHKCK